MGKLTAYNVVVHSEAVSTYQKRCMWHNITLCEVKCGDLEGWRRTEHRPSGSKPSEFMCIHNPVLLCLRPSQPCVALCFSRCFCYFILSCDVLYLHGCIQEHRTDGTHRCMRTQRCPETQRPAYSHSLTHTQTENVTVINFESDARIVYPASCFSVRLWAGLILFSFLNFKHHVPFAGFLLSPLFTLSLTKVFNWCQICWLLKQWSNYQSVVCSTAGDRTRICRYNSNYDFISAEQRNCPFWSSSTAKLQWTDSTQTHMHQPKLERRGYVMGRKGMVTIWKHVRGEDETWGDVIALAARSMT